MIKATQSNWAEPSRRKHRPGRVLLFAVAALFTPIVLLLVVAMVNNRTAELNIPTHTVPADSALPALHQASLLAKQMPHPSPYSMPLKSGQQLTAADFANCANDATQTIAALQAAIKLPFVEHANRSSRELMPEFAEMRELTRILASVADHYEIVGDYGRAMDLRLDGLEFGVKIPRQGSILPELVGSAVQAISISRIEELLPHLTPNQLANAAVRLDAIEATETSYSDIVIEEGYTATSNLKEIFKEFRLTPKGINALHESFGSGAMGDMSTMGKLRETGNMTRLVLASKRGILESTLEYCRSVSKEVSGPYKAALTSQMPMPLGANGFGDSMMLGWQKHLGMQAVRRILRAEIALELYHNAKGKYPQSAGQLVPEYLKAVPSDPFSPTMGPLIYQREQNQYVVYSIGPDMRDDAGTPAKYVGAMPGDIVSGYLAGARKRSPLPTTLKY
jgi:hypothetical protein